MPFIIALNNIYIKVRIIYNYSKLRKRRDYYEKKVAAILLVFAGLLLPAVLPNTGSNVTAHAQAFTVVQVNANNVRVRRGPGTNYDALGQVHKGQNFEVVGSDAGEWIKIKYNTNGVKYGYIYHKYVDSHTCYR